MFHGRPRLFNFVAKQQVWHAGIDQRERAEWVVSDDGMMVVIANGERRLDFMDMADGSLLFSARLPRPVARSPLSPRMTRWAFKRADDNTIWIADLTVGPRLADSDQLRPLAGVAFDVTGSVPGAD